MTRWPRCSARISWLWKSRGVSVIGRCTRSWRRWWTNSPRPTPTCQHQSWTSSGRHRARTSKFLPMPSDSGRTRTMALSFPSAIYFLCSLTSLAATVLLVRSFVRNRSTLLLWSALAFVALTANNLLLFADFLLPPSIDLRPERVATELLAVGLLLYGFIWEID